MSDLPDRVPLSKVETGPSAQEPPPVADPELARKGDMGYMDDLEYHRVADFLEIGYEERKISGMAEKLSYLYDWAKEATKSDDRIVRLEAIRTLQRSLGIQGKGAETIGRLWQYARLDQHRRKIEREMSLLSGEPVVK